jgi:cytochrome P450
MEPLIEAIAADLVSALPDGAQVDFIDSAARPLPIYAILRILGLPESRRDDVVRWSDAATASLGAQLTPQRWVEVERDTLSFQQVVGAELDARREHPRDDLLSVLAQGAAGTDGDPDLSTNELVWLVRELIVAGNETTTRAVAEIVLHLDDHPDQWSRLRDDPQFLAGVVEEGVRLASPAIGMFRRVTRDTELGGVPLPAGSTVYLVYGSANRDEHVYADADEWLPERANLRDHVAFGHGIHVCVGAGLARMEAAAVLRTMADQLAEVRVVDRASLRYLPSFFIRGLEHLPVMVRRR